MFTGNVMVKQRPVGPTGLISIAPINGVYKKHIHIKTILRQSILVPHWPVIVGYFFQYAVGGPFLEPLGEDVARISRRVWNLSNLQTRRKQSRRMGCVQRSPIIDTLRATEHFFSSRLIPTHSILFHPAFTTGFGLGSERTRTIAPALLENRMELSTAEGVADRCRHAVAREHVAPASVMAKI
jgi:hypothetical protein